MIAISSIELFTVLKDKLGEQQAKMLTEYVEYKVTDSFDRAKDHLATKEDIAKLDTKISETKADILKWMIALFAPFYIGMIVFLIKQFL